MKLPAASKAPAGMMSVRSFPYMLPLSLSIKYKPGNVRHDVAVVRGSSSGPLSVSVSIFSIPIPIAIATPSTYQAI